ncbi:hypothetical protein EJ08DRAFT_697675 [Tothia fuscella]|uniref:Fungal N-terminal domain-containing protein n=1 Tax=Tothia fuscella TaxID=1048955 RepID=A0A9P4TYR2_9PEZI|nr:hypothetical protein EJ08DRAFT_697675 [Tothia fuscella]
MVDPLSTTTGVVGLLTACIKIGGELQDLYNGAAVADATVKLMDETLNQPEAQLSFRTTGHIGNHLKNISKSIQDGETTLTELQRTLQKVDKDVSMLGSSRKHYRLKGAFKEISMYQQQIRSYKDTMQVSMSAMILWNQVSSKDAVDKILSNLNEIQQTIRRQAHLYNDRVHILERTPGNPGTDQSQLDVLINLRQCLRSAADIVSSASTTLGVAHPDQIPSVYGSDFGDCFPYEPNESMRRWMQSNSIYEFGEDVIEASSSGYPSQLQQQPSVMQVQHLRGDGEGETESESESDSEEVEKIQALLTLGKEKLAEQDYESAERLFINCLARTSNPGTRLLSALRGTAQARSIDPLLNIYRRQENWDAAQKLLKRQIKSNAKTGTFGGPSYSLLLAELFLDKFELPTARKSGMKAYRGFRKLGVEGLPGVQSSLRLLIRVCNAAGDFDEEDAYASILSGFSKGSQLSVQALDLSMPKSTMSDSADAPNELKEPGHQLDKGRGLVELGTSLDLTVQAQLEKPLELHASLQSSGHSFNRFDGNRSSPTSLEKPSFLDFSTISGVPLERQSPRTVGGALVVPSLAANEDLSLAFTEVSPSEAISPARASMSSRDDIDLVHSAKPLLLGQKMSGTQDLFLGLIHSTAHPSH